MTPATEMAASNFVTSNTSFGPLFPTSQPIVRNDRVGATTPTYINEILTTPTIDALMRRPANSSLLEALLRHAMLREYANAAARIVATAPPADIAAMTFEQALSELEQIVARLESGQAPLEDSIRMYERGAALKAHCETRLEAARLRVEKIVMGAAGQPGVEPAEFS